MADLVYLLDNCRFLSSTEGTGAYSQGVTPSGYLAPAAAGAVSQRRYTWRVESEDGATWELIEGRWVSGSPATVQRDRVIRNSGGGTAAINWPPGVRRITCVGVADRLAVLDTDGRLPPTQAPPPQLTAIVTTAVRTVEFSIPSGWKGCRVSGMNLRNSVTNQPLCFRLRRAGQSAFDAGGTDYNVSWVQRTANTPAGTVAGDNYNQSYGVAGHSLQDVAGGIGVFNADLSSITGGWARMQSFWSGYVENLDYLSLLSTRHTPSGTIDRIQFFFLDGNIQPGADFSIQRTA